MVKLIAQHGQELYDHQEWVVDTLSDLANLPKNSGMGSTAFVIETSQVFMKNSKGEWVEV